MSLTTMSPICRPSKDESDIMGSDGDERADGDRRDRCGIRNGRIRFRGHVGGDRMPIKGRMA
jgi:hypothetical protein